jgi:His-Xaa-Ser system radical SAM maturase HxsB
MNLWPLRFREFENGRFVLANDAGGFFTSDEDFISRYAAGRLTADDRAFLHREGHAFNEIGDLNFTGFAYRWTARQNARRKLAYLILVPTLRCNLSCTYCQVSRAAETARGYDWTDGVLADVLRFIDGLDADDVKIEFQGGEPLLRVDLLEAVRSFCREKFREARFTVCTNLQNVGSRELAFLEDEDTWTSTSIDGPLAVHDHQRTQHKARAAEFFRNLEALLRRVGVGRVSALPTVDIFNPPDFDELIDTYEGFGFRSIYLRPVNYQGFARRIPPRGDEAGRWNALHAAFLDHLIDRNSRTGRVVEEFYFSYCLRRVLQAGHDSHVDLRNPALLGTDYVVVDFDGRLYPTDEARMLARIGQVDLSIGSVAEGINAKRVALLNANATNSFDPDCIHCPYQPFCGSDPIDDLSRYGRVDRSRAGTWFCDRQLALFDRVMRLIYSRDEKELFSLRHWVGLNAWPATLAPWHQ